MPPTKMGAVLGLLVTAGLLGLSTSCAVPPAPASARAAPPVAAAAGTPAGVQTVPQGPLPPSYPGYVPQNGYQPPPAQSGYVTPTAYQAPVNTGYTPAPGYQPSNTGYAPSATAAGPGLVPVGATGTAVVDHDVIPASVTGLPPAAPGVPGSSPVSSPEPIVASPVRADGKDGKDEDSGFDWAKLAPDAVWKNVKTAAGYGPDEPIARAAFQEGEALFHQKQYEEAAKKFYTASWRWPESSLEEDALFLMGESYFFADRYSQAYDAYAMLLKGHENTRYLDTVMAREFAIARFWEQTDEKSHYWPVVPNVTDKTLPWFDTRGNALGAYEAVRLHDPTGPLADVSIFATANNHFRNHEWEEADYHYGLVRKDYPKSQYQKDAHILGLQSKLQIYEGPLYEVAPLDGAKEVADQTLKQFHGRLGEEETRVAETRAHIIAEKAEREWAMAQYYEKKKAFGAARHYYKTLIETYPRTPDAERARHRLEEIRNEPDNPPKHFEWLTRMFERER